jgi:hypothetical protein
VRTDIQCTDARITKEVSDLVKESPLGHLLGTQMLYLNDMKELRRTKDELRCEATLHFNAEWIESNRFVIKLYNQDGHALIALIPQPATRQQCQDRLKIFNFDDETTEIAIKSCMAALRNTENSDN